MMAPGGGRGASDLQRRGDIPLQHLNRGVERKLVAMAVRAALYFDLAAFEPARADDELERQADEIHTREFLAGPRGVSS